jgi:hypothetical protein
MKKVLCVLCMLLLGFGMLGVANAALFDRGGGLIYDDVLDITWLQDASYGAGSAYDDGSNTTDGFMTWNNAVAWADQLEYQGYKDWRLPTTVDGPYVFGYDGTTTGGYNITSSEMGYMYYVNLGNLGYIATDGTNPQPGWGLTNTGPFNNLQPNLYWSGTEYGSSPGDAWVFYLYNGSQSNVYKDGGIYQCAWAVRPGDSAPVPVPPAVYLLGSGLIGIMGIRRKFNK